MHYRLRFEDLLETIDYAFSDFSENKITLVEETIPFSLYPKYKCSHVRGTISVPFPKQDVWLHTKRMPMHGRRSMC